MDTVQLPSAGDSQWRATSFGRIYLCPHQPQWIYYPPHGSTAKGFITGQLRVEGLARQLDPELDIWGVAKPELEAILRQRHNPENISKELRKRLPGWLAQAPELPALIHDFLEKANSGQLLARTSSEDAARARREQKAANRKMLQVLAGGSLSIPGAILVGLETGPWFLAGYSTVGLLLLAAGGGLILRGLRHTRT